MTPVLCQPGAYGSVPAFPSFPPEPDDRDLVPCWKGTSGRRPIPSSIKKPSPQLAVALRTPLSGVLRAGQASGRLAWDSLCHQQPYCPSAVASKSLRSHGQHLLIIIFYFFQWDLEPAQREASSHHPSPPAASLSTTLPRLWLLFLEHC